MATHELVANPDTVHWGHYDASLEPVMRIRSGDTLEVHTESGREEYLAELGERASRNLRDIVSQVPQELGPHIMTGPVAVERCSSLETCWKFEFMKSRRAMTGDITPSGR